MWSAMELQRLGRGADDVETVLDLLLAAPTYGRRTLGRTTTPADAVALLSDRPPGCGVDAKSVFLIGVDGVPVGLVDVIRGRPETGTAHIGLLLIREDRQQERPSPVVGGASHEARVLLRTSGRDGPG